MNLSSWRVSLCNMELLQIWQSAGDTAQLLAYFIGSLVFGAATVFIVSSLISGIQKSRTWFAPIIASVFMLSIVILGGLATLVTTALGLHLLDKWFDNTVLVVIGIVWFIAVVGAIRLAWIATLRE